MQKVAWRTGRIRCGRGSAEPDAPSPEAAHAAARSSRKRTHGARTTPCSTVKRPTGDAIGCRGRHLASVPRLRELRSTAGAPGSPVAGDRVAPSVALRPPVMIDLWSCPTERGRPRLSRASQAERARPGTVARMAIGPTWMDSRPFIQAAAEIPQPGAARPACRGRSLPRRQRSGRPPPRRTGCPGRVVGSTACICGPSHTSTRRSVPAARGTGWARTVGPGIPADLTVTAR